MFLIKLDAIGSTNSFLKEYVKEHDAVNFTTVVAETQTQGRGQLGTEWASEHGKNLMFSVFVKNHIANTQKIFDLNCIVTVSILHILQNYNLPDLFIKWPNDILSDNKKIVGILIENSIKTNGSIESIIGIGINVNQKNFENLPKASSIYNLKGIFVDKDILLNDILTEIVANFNLYLTTGADRFWTIFHDNLFKKNIPSLFLNEKTQQQFIATIKKVTEHGLLEIELEDKTIKNFGLKEISIIY